MSCWRRGFAGGEVTRSIVATPTRRLALTSTAVVHLPRPLRLPHLLPGLPLSIQMSWDHLGYLSLAGSRPTRVQLQHGVPC